MVEYKSVFDGQDYIYTWRCYCNGNKSKSLMWTKQLHHCIIEIHFY